MLKPFSMSPLAVLFRLFVATTIPPKCFQAEHSVQYAHCCHVVIQHHSKDLYIMVVVKPSLFGSGIFSGSTYGIYFNVHSFSPITTFFWSSAGRVCGNHMACTLRRKF